jgi:hypothetical protein
MMEGRARKNIRGKQEDGLRKLRESRKKTKNRKHSSGFDQAAEYLLKRSVPRENLGRATT